MNYIFLAPQASPPLTSGLPGTLTNLSQHCSSMSSLGTLANRSSPVATSHSERKLALKMCVPRSEQGWMMWQVCTAAFHQREIWSTHEKNILKPQIMTMWFWFSLSGVGQKTHLMQVVLRPHGRNHVTGTHYVAFNEANGISMDTQILLLNASYKRHKNLPFTVKYRRDLASKGI